MVRKQERCLGNENMVAEINSVGIKKISQYIKKNDTWKMRQQYVREAASGRSNMLLLETPDPDKKWREAVKGQQNSPQLKVGIRPQIENSYSSFEQDEQEQTHTQAPFIVKL